MTIRRREWNEILAYQGALDVCLGPVGTRQPYKSILERKPPGVRQLRRVAARLAVLMAAGRWMEGVRATKGPSRVIKDSLESQCRSKIDAKHLSSWWLWWRALLRVNGFPLFLTEGMDKRKITL